MSQQSCQSILYNAQAATKTTTVAASNNQHVLPSNTIKSSNSNGSNGNSNSVKASNSNCDNGNIVSNSNNNLINHHYEDLQMNPITGNLVSTSSAAHPNLSLRALTLAVRFMVLIVWITRSSPSTFWYRSNSKSDFSFTRVSFGALLKEVGLKSC